MGYVPVSKPQTGVRQYGVDLPIVGKSPEDGVDELVLLTIKRGDLGRNDWDVGAQAVRPSLIEILDVYLRTHVEPSHQGLRKKIILATTGEMKQDTQLNWTSFVDQYKDRATFEFWSGDKVAELIERYMLDEHVFPAEDRTDIRKALAFAGEPDYLLSDLNRVLLRQLGLDDKGQNTGTLKDGKQTGKAMLRLNLAIRMFTKTAQDAGDTKKALKAAELAALRAWHRIQQSDPSTQALAYEGFSHLWTTYNDCAVRYFNKLQPYMAVRDGMSGYSRESAEYAIVLLEHVGLVATVGLANLLEHAIDQAQADENMENACAVAQSLCDMVANMQATASPRLDGNVIDVVLALLLMVQTGHVEEAKKWLTELCQRLDFCFKRKLDFPIGSDSLDDLVEATVWSDDTLINELMRTSWMTATLASWCALLALDDVYEILAKGINNSYQNVVPQLWHPDADWQQHWYFRPAQHSCGNTEAPYSLPDSAEELRKRMRQFLTLAPFDIQNTSSAAKAGMQALDFIACRHYRTPVPAWFWYKMLPPTDPSAGVILTTT
jgi:hypothetical protein